MGDKRRNVIDILSLLFIIFFGCGVIGYMYRDKTPEPTPTPVNPTANTINYNGNERSVAGLNDRLIMYEFVKANKEFSSSYLNVAIEGNVVKLRIQKAGITNATDTTPDPVEYTIDSVASPVAVQAQMLANENNFTRVYILDASNKLYCVMLAANPANYNGIMTYQYNIDNIESFATITTPLEEQFVTDQVYVIFKTTDGTYYTDYVFSIDDSDFIITKLGTMDYQPNYDENQVVENTDEIPPVEVPAETVEEVPAEQTEEVPNEEVVNTEDVPPVEPVENVE